MEKRVISKEIGGKGQKKFKVKKGPKSTEQDVDIDVTSATTDEEFIVEQLDIETLDQTIKINDKDEKIVWFNNFVIKKKKQDGSDGDPINQSYKVKISGLGAWRAPSKYIIIQDGNANNGRAYIFTGSVEDDTIELTDGDPGVGGAPPSV